LVAVGVIGTLGLGVAACGKKSSSGGGKASGTSLTIYSSLPLQGSSRDQSQAVINGAKLALKERGGKVGKYKIKYVSLDDSTASAAAADPGQTSQNARKASQDKSTIAYIGEYNSGATAVSLPILNQGGILQVSPLNTAVGLTSNAPGHEPGTPDKYYPTGKRTYGRVVPKDTVQGAALATLMTGEGCKAVYILNDKSVYGAGLARNVEIAAKAAGLKVDGDQGIDPKAPNYRSQAQQIKSDCFMFSGTVDQNAVQVYKDVAAADSSAKLFGADGVAQAAFSDPKQGGIPANIASRTIVTVAKLDSSQYPPAGRKFFKDYSRVYKVKNPDPYAIYGYESMNIVLDSIQKAGAKGNDRQAVIDAFFNQKNRKSVLGTYSIDKNGDTTLTDYGSYKIQGGALAFYKTIKAKK
jgi:branched-chain amino acid transport system substrate-binding protein